MNTSSVIEKQPWLCHGEFSGLCAVVDLCRLSQHSLILFYFFLFHS